MCKNSAKLRRQQELFQNNPQDVKIALESSCVWIWVGRSDNWNSEPTKSECENCWALTALDGHQTDSVWLFWISPWSFLPHDSEMTGKYLFVIAWTPWHATTQAFHSWWASGSCCESSCRDANWMTQSLLSSKSFTNLGRFEQCMENVLTPSHSQVSFNSSYNDTSFRRKFNGDVSQCTCVSVCTCPKLLWNYFVHQGSHI